VSKGEIEVLRLLVLGSAQGQSPLQWMGLDREIWDNWVCTSLRRRTMERDRLRLRSRGLVESCDQNWRLATAGRDAAEALGFRPRRHLRAAME
jgi:hypothetical protein